MLQAKHLSDQNELWWVLVLFLFERWTQSSAFLKGQTEESAPLLEIRLLIA